MKRIIPILLFLFFVTTSSFSQVNDSLNRRLTFSYNLVQLPINELSMYADYHLNQKNSFGINVGYIYINPRFEVFFLSPDQGTYPGTVWEGAVFRGNYKRSFSRNAKKYFEFQFIYKTLHYRNQYFENYVDHDYYRFRRDEHANLFGLDALWGKHFLPFHSRMDLELFGGIGFRGRIRHYTTISSSPEIANPLGSFVLKQFYIEPLFGFKIGFNCFLKK